MVHWDCDADLSKDHKSSNERLVEIICANNGALLKEWLGKGSGDGKKEPLCRQVLAEFQAQGVTHRKTTRDIRNAMTQLVKRYEATQSTIKSSGKGNDVMHYVDGKPVYPQGKDKFESCMRTRFPFYWDLREYLGDTNVKHKSKGDDDAEVNSLEVAKSSEQIKKTPIKRRKKADEEDKRPAKYTTARVTFAPDCPPPPPPFVATDNEKTTKKDYHKEYLELKRRKIEIQQHEMMIIYQTKAIELMSQHCNTPEDKEELRRMVKTFGKNAFPSLDFSTNNTQATEEEDELFYSDCN